MAREDGSKRERERQKEGREAGGERERERQDAPINDAHALTPARAFTILFIIYAKLCGASPWIP